jgi:hypothetical protein
MRTAKTPIAIKLGKYGIKIFVLVLIMLTYIHKSTTYKLKCILANHRTNN